MDLDVPLAETMSDVTRICHRRDDSLDADIKPDLDGPLILTFAKHVDGKRVGEPIPITIVGRPNDVTTKRKHYWIYSSLGYGKSTTVRVELRDKFNAVSLPDPRNAFNIPSTAQFLVLDDSSRIPMSQLKRLTGGNAAAGYLHRKSYHRRYVPRADVQFVILNSHSPYEVYAKKGKRMDAADMQVFDECFHVIRLDGSNADEKLTFTVPSDLIKRTKALSRYEFREAMYKILYDKIRFLNEMGVLTCVSVRDVLAESYRLYLDRFEHKKRVLSTDTFLLYLRSLLHEGDVAVYEGVHTKYARVKGYTTAKEGTTVIVPVMRRPDWHTRHTVWMDDEDEDALHLAMDLFEDGLLV